MANEKRLSELLVGNGMDSEHLGELYKNYFVSECVRWFYFDLDTDIPDVVTSSGKEIDIRLKHEDYPEQVTIELVKENASNNVIDYGRLTSELIKQIRELPLKPPYSHRRVEGIALTVGKEAISATEKFLLLELYIKDGGKIKMVHTIPPIIGDNLTPTSIPPRKKRK